MGLGDNLDNDLSLGSLSEDQAIMFDDIVINKEPEGTTPAPAATVNKPAPNADDIILNSSEDPKSPESVAGDESKTKTPGSNANSNSSPDDSMSQIYSSLATHLHSSGVLSTLDETKPIKSFTDIQDAIKSEIKNGLESTVKSYKEAMERGVPESKFVAYEKNMAQLNGIDDATLKAEDSGDLRMKIIAQDFINKGIDSEEAMRYAKRSADLNEDIIDSARALDRIKEFTKSNFEKEQESLKNEEEKVNNDIKQFIDSKSEIIDGIKIDDNLKAKLLNQITTPIARNKNGEVLSKYGKALTDEPVKMRVVSEYLFMITDGFKDFSKLNNTIETAKTMELDNILKNNMSAFTEGGGQASTSQTDSQMNFLMKDITIDG